VVSIYLSNHTLQIAVGNKRFGKLFIKKLILIEDIGSCVVNGIILDPIAFEEKMKDIWEKNRLPRRNISLVIQSTQFNTKVLEIPRMKEKKTLSFLRREMGSTFKMNMPLYGYHVLNHEPKRKINQVIAVGVEQEYIGRMNDLFRTMGLSISSIESAVGAGVQFGKKSKSGVEKRSCVIQLFEKNNSMNILLVEGQYAYSEQKRIFSNPGTQEFANEVARNVRNMISFAKSQRIAEKIPIVIMGGLDEKDLEQCSQLISPINGGMDVFSLSNENKVNLVVSKKCNVNWGKMFQAVSGLWKADSTSNFFRQYKMAKMEKYREARMKLSALGIWVCFLLVAALGATNKQEAYKEEIEKLCRAIENPILTNNVLRYGRAEMQRYTYTEAQQQMEAVEKAIGTYPVLNSQIEQKLRRCAHNIATVEVLSMNAMTGTISFIGITHSETGGYQFVDRLKQEPQFENVHYIGYEEDERGWVVNVTCQIRPQQKEER